MIESSGAALWFRSNGGNRPASSAQGEDSARERMGG
jgi:hypothetical protein